MFSAGTWLRAQQPSHRTFLLLQQGMGRVATARRLLSGLGFTGDVEEALWILPCSSQQFQLSPTGQTSSGCFGSSQRVVAAPWDEEEDVLPRIWIRDWGLCDQRENPGMAWVGWGLKIH